MRARIIDAMADLLLVRGVHGTTLDDIRSVTGASRSQLFQYFPDGKDELIRAVAARQVERVLPGQVELRRLDGMPALQRWRDAIIAAQRALDCVGGCPLGSLASEIGEHDEPTRELLAVAFNAVDPGTERWAGQPADDRAWLQPLVSCRRFRGHRGVAEAGRRYPVPGLRLCC